MVKVWIKCKQKNKECWKMPHAKKEPNKLQSMNRKKSFVLRIETLSIFQIDLNPVQLIYFYSYLVSALNQISRYFL